MPPARAATRPAEIEYHVVRFMLDLLEQANTNANYGAELQSLFLTRTRSRLSNMPV